MPVPKAQHPMPFTRIELCVFTVKDGQLQVLLGRRSGPPFQGAWALPGGVLRIDLDNGLQEAAQRISTERLHLNFEDMRQQGAIGGPTRDPDRSQWALSIVYRTVAQANDLDPHAGKRLEELKWVSADKAATDKKLALDHHRIIKDAVTDLRNQVRNLEIPFAGISSPFTLGELQTYCQALLNSPLDKASFRRRLDEKGVVTPLKGEFRGGANRPAQLYQPKTGRTK